MFCYKCGSKMAEDAGFCHMCGTKVIRAGEGTARPAPIEPIAVSAPAPPPPQASPIIPDRRRQNVTGLCKPMFALRLADAIGWTLLIIVQIWGGVGFWRIVWNVVGTIAHYALAVQLFGVVSSGDFNSVRVLRVVGNNLFISIIGIIFYGWQFFSDDIFILLLFIGVEIAILVVGVIAYFSAKQINIETMPKKDMTVRFQQGEAVILNGKCTRSLYHNKRNYLYNGVGTLTNTRFVFTSNAGNTPEWAADTYGVDAPFQEMTDFIILLSDISGVSGPKKRKDGEDLTLTIQTKDGKSHSFAFEVTIKDAWTNPNKWLNAFQNAVTGVS